MILEVVFFNLLTTSSGRFSEFDYGNAILFQIKVFSNKIKETTLLRYFVKATAHPSFYAVKVNELRYKYCQLTPQFFNLFISFKFYRKKY